MLDLGFVDGAEYAKKRENIIYIKTGSKNFDNLLGGGVLKAGPSQRLSGLTEVERLKLG